MLNHLYRKKRPIGRGAYKQFVAMPIGTPSTSVRILAGIRQAALIMGLTATFTLGLMFVKPDLADDILALSPFANRSSDEDVTSVVEWSRIARAVVNTGNEKTQVSLNADLEDRVTAGGPIEKKRVTQWIAKRYRVANDAAGMLVTEAYSAANETNLDPLLILSVIAIESRFNPFAESPVGAQGLMQVMSRCTAKSLMIMAV
jgi:hypothetical protein